MDRDRLVGYRMDVGSLEEIRGIGGDGLCGMVVGDDENYVGRVGLLFLVGGRGREG